MGGDFLWAVEYNFVPKWIIAPPPGVLQKYHSDKFDVNILELRIYRFSLGSILFNIESLSNDIYSLEEMVFSYDTSVTSSI